MGKIKGARELPGKRSWHGSFGSYLNGQAAIDGADQVALEMERKWGSGRLRLLVSLELRQKFDRQRLLYQAVIQHGETAEAVARESQRMILAWRALDGAAEAAGALKLAPVVWEVALKDGAVAALVRSGEEAHALVTASGREFVVYTMEEIGRMLDNYQAVTRVKEAFPGAKVTAVRQSIEDPLNAIRDGRSLDDPFDDPIPDLGL